jgi:hypothetical protein
MAGNFQKVLGLRLIGLMLLTARQLTVKVQNAEQIAGDRIVADRRPPYAAESEPSGFLVVDIQLTAEGGISLNWSDLGSNFVYRVESTHFILGRWFMVEPFDQWPTSATSWTDTSVPISACAFIGFRRRLCTILPLLQRM